MMTGTQAHSGRTSGRAAVTSFRPQMLPADSFRLAVAQWFFAANECRLDLAPSEQKSDFHRGYLSSLIGWGECAQMVIEEKRIDLSPIGVTVEDLKAETRILSDTYRSAFDNCLSESEAETVLKEVFG